MTTRNKVAVITGASGGLGYSYVKYLAAKGYELVTTARREDILKAQAEEIKNEFNVEVTVIPADLATEDGIDKVANYVKELKRVDLLVNCAGYAEGSLFADKSYAVIKQMMDIHMRSVVRLTYECIPIMKNQGGGNIIVVSSLSAFIPAPASSIYASSKAFLNSFVESVYMEVKDAGINMQSLCPGLTNTDFHKKSGRKQPVRGGLVNFWLEPDEVVKRSINKLGSGKVVYVPGFMNKLTRLVVSLLPRKIYYNIASGVAKDFND